MLLGASPPKVLFSSAAAAICECHLCIVACPTVASHSYLAFPSRFYPTAVGHETDTTAVRRSRPHICHLFFFLPRALSFAPLSIATTVCSARRRRRRLLHGRSPKPLLHRVCDAKIEFNKAFGNA